MVKVSTVSATPISANAEGSGTESTARTPVDSVNEIVLVPSLPLQVPALSTSELFVPLSIQLTVEKSPLSPSLMEIKSTMKGEREKPLLVVTEISRVPA